MTPLQIMDDELETQCRALAYFRKSFQDALFRHEETRSEIVKEFDIGQATCLSSAKILIKRTIENIRFLRCIKARMQSDARISRTYRKGRRV